MAFQRRFSMSVKIRSTRLFLFLLRMRLPHRFELNTRIKALNPLTLPVRAMDPGIFRIGSTEFGAILNQDNTVNTPENPAARGSVITFWTTGMGLFDNAYADGSIIGANASSLRLPVRVSLSGLDSQMSLCRRIARHGCRSSPVECSSAFQYSGILANSDRLNYRRYQRG